GAAVGTDGSGTQGMAARIAQLGGSFRGGRRPGTGGEPDRWVVEVRVPGAGCPVAPVVGAVSERLAGRANGRVGA
ncbi:MAG TPA: hypothetical protein VGE77_10970, partial [Nocardioides sp.]